LASKFAGRQSLFIDLFAGLGGASQAFVNDPDWTVLQFDNNPDLIPYNPNLIMMDLSNVQHTLRQISILAFAHEFAYHHVVIWASPPCYEFSLAKSAPRMLAHEAGLDFKPDMTLAQATDDLIYGLRKMFAPYRYGSENWVIENVRGASKYFEPIFGKWRQHNGSQFLWGFYPKFDIETDESKASIDKRHSPIRANIRAKIPIEISQNLKDAIENQTRLF